MPISLSQLQGNLNIGLSVFNEQWRVSAKNQVTGIHAIDIDQDGDMDVLASSRDGREI